MSEYLGYRITINGITVPDDMIGKGSWSAVPQKRKIYSWVDANQYEHDENAPHRKMDITFNIRRRYLNEHESIIGIFELEDNITVEYWDDKTCTYKSGLFKMEAAEFTHRNTERGTIEYEPTPIHLTEY